MSKLRKVLAVSALVCSLAVTPAMAAPSAGDIERGNKEVQDEGNLVQKEITSLVLKIDNLEVRIEKARKEAVEKAEKIEKAKKEAARRAAKKARREAALKRASAIVEEAYSYLGVPYKWGGSSRKGIDCSGLTMNAHRAAGISLSHSSGAQGAGGKHVANMASALPGDLVCYSGHVGIYIGNGQMIHAPRPGKVVQVIKVYGNPWFRRYW